ncbi:ABC transporter permease [Bacillus sp. HMF5848]|uniref:permease-like cell division protein FtsX n=1 Tax=Bacillus sp. HMF5848 TaxID=2495421 RepID=UPI000F7BAB4E|nr:permease-like cell division protein FtsX [Bacillus sp. HMF5848]RSK28598.1 ABC transporter permease [Bacillus sp. HMF5848]
MTFRTVRRHFRESFKSLGRNGWMTFASVSAVTVTLLLVGVFLVLMLNLNNFATMIEQDVEIRVHVDLVASPEQQGALKQQIEDIQQVSSVTFSSKDEQLDNLIKSFGEDGEAFELFEQANPLYDVFIVKTDDPEDIMTVANQIDSFPYTERVVFGKDQVEKLFKILKVSRNVGLGLILGLVFTAMFLISNTIKITIFARQKEIEIMRLVGATNNFIRVPFFLEGLWLGVVGAILPIAAVASSYQYLYSLISPKLANTFIQLLPPSPFIWEVAGILVGIGGLIGVWGSLMSVRRFLTK